ncbi:MAG: electron transport complex subunit RsxE [Methylococcus sp.]|jgi:electron transport complex protein RnfE
MNNPWRITAKLAHEGLWSHNPALVSLLGLCPLLALSTSLVHALTLGLATSFVLITANGLISGLRHHLVQAARLPLFMFIMAAMVTAVDLLLKALIPELHEIIGLFIPLIVTNCQILARAEAFASRQPIPLALMDGAFMGLGFTGVMVLLGSIREILGSGHLLGQAEQLFGEAAKTWSVTVIANVDGFLLALLPPGAFLTLGCLIAGRNLIMTRRTHQQPIHPMTLKDHKSRRIEPSKASGASHQGDLKEAKRGLLK